MRLRLVRKNFSEVSTIGEIFVDDRFACFSLEDRDRNLSSDMPPEEIQRIKVPAQTCIPYGTYKIDVSFSNHFQKNLPILLNVPGYEGVRIHSGNTPQDTEGCILPGLTKGTDSVGQSRDAFNLLFPQIQNAVAAGDCWIDIVKEEEPPTV